MKKTIYIIMAMSILTLIFSLQSPLVMHAQETNACTNLLLNGDMENDAGWLLDSGSLASRYVPTAMSGNQGLLVGPAETGSPTGRVTLSTAWQSVTLPEGMTTLSFSYWGQTGPEAGSDRQYVALLSSNGEVVTPLLNILENGETWQSFTADVSEYAGETVWVYFQVENDGTGDSTRLFVDEVMLCGETVAVEPVPISTPITVSAPVSATLPALTADPVEDLYSFEQLGFEENILSGPFDSVNYRLGLPANWELTSGTSVELHLTMLGVSIDPINGQNAAATLNVLFNDVLLETTVLQLGSEVRLSLPISDAALDAQRPDSRHQLELLLDSSNSCGQDETVALLVHTDSTFQLPYQTKMPTTDLRLFPKPIFQDSFLPETAVIVIPDQPSEDDLQAAFTLAAGLGQLSNGGLAISLLPESNLTIDVRETNSLIFVGLPEALPLLNQIDWPVSPADGRFDIAEMQSDDGVLQMAVSPWNSGLATMLVSGSSPNGVIKAAQAVSQGTIQAVTRSDLAIVADIDHPLPLGTPTEGDKSLADLGYLDQELRGRSRRTIEYEFNMPSGYIAGEEAYIELVFSHSDLLNYDESGLVVRLNDRTIGSSRLGESGSTLKSVKISLPRSTLHSGINHISVRSEMVPLSECVDPSFDGIWLTLWSESRLSIPLLPVSGGVRPTLDLGNFPAPFDQEPTLQDVAFVVPTQDPVAWNTAVQIAAILGDKSNTPLTLLKSRFADRVTDEFREAHHLIIIGQPADLPLLADMSEVMPAPFSAGENFPNEQALPVQFRFAADASIGYLELFPAPWATDRAVLTVLGSTAQGVQWAGLSLTVSELRGRLASNLAVVQDQQVVIGEKLIAISSLETSVADTAVITTQVTVTESIAEATVAPVVLPETTVQEQQPWIVPALAVSGGLIGLIIVIVLGSTFLQYRRSRRP